MQSYIDAYPYCAKDYPKDAPNCHIEYDWQIQTQWNTKQYHFVISHYALNFCIESNRYLVEQRTNISLFILVVVFEVVKTEKNNSCHSPNYV